MREITAAGGLMVGRSILAVILGAMPVLAGCQTNGNGLTLDPAPIAAETAALASNELFQLGRNDLAAGNFGLAERHFREAVERNGDDGPSWLGLAAAYDNLRRFELADRAYAQVTRIQGETLALLNNRAYSFFLRGDRRRALAQLRRARTLYPTSIIVRNNIGLVATGERPNRAETP